MATIVVGLYLQKLTWLDYNTYSYFYNITEKKSTRKTENIKRFEGVNVNDVDV
jgi:hypothetical protein